MYDAGMKNVVRVGGSWLGEVSLALALGCGDSTAMTGASATGGQGSTGGTGGTPGSTGTDAPTGTASAGSATSGMTDGSATSPTTSAGPTTDPTVASDPTTATDTSMTSMTSMTSTTSMTGMTSESTGDTVGTTGDPGTTSGVVPDTTTGAEGTTGAGEGSTTGEPPPPCEPGDGMGGGKVEKSFIWISSFNLNEMSKVDTLTMTELARYKTGPGNQNPSRTAVSADGRYVVVNNRDSGRSTMVAANEADCIDNNGNGIIDTSQNKNNILAFGADECVRWSVVLPFAGNHQSGPRGVTWTPGEWSYDECKYVEPKVWVGYLAAGNVAHFARIDGETGVVEETLLAPGWKGQLGYGPYGAALDPQFRPWFSSLRSEFIRVNTDQDPITLTRIDPPAFVQSYGFTIDRDGDAWFGGWDGPVTVYDQKNQTFTAVPGTSGAHRGVAADENFVWAAHNSPCQLIQVDRNTRTLIAKHVTNPCNTAIGLSIDVEKYVWLIDQGGFAWKFKPDNVPGAMKIDIAGSHYVYSDMTGGQLLSILPQ